MEQGSRWCPQYPLKAPKVSLETTLGTALVNLGLPLPPCQLRLQSVFQLQILKPLNTKGLVEKTPITNVFLKLILVISLSFHLVQISAPLGQHFSCSRFPSVLLIQTFTLRSLNLQSPCSCQALDAAIVQSPFPLGAEEPKDTPCEFSGFQPHCSLLPFYSSNPSCLRCNNFFLYLSLHKHEEPKVTRYSQSFSFSKTLIVFPIGNVLSQRTEPLTQQHLSSQGQKIQICRLVTGSKRGQFYFYHLAPLPLLYSYWRL